MTRPDAWHDLLEPGEDILWQGRPDPRPDWSALNPQRAATGAALSLAALAWIVVAQGDSGPLLPALGLPVLAIGLYQIAGHVLWDSFRRARSWYTLTNRRAFIATDLPLRGRQLRAYPITRDTILTFDNAPLASIGFAFEPVPMKRGTRMRMLGFERIADGQTVFALIRGVQGKIERDLPPPHDKAGE